MIVFRQTDRRYPFLWESDAQPAGRWHADGDGPAHYFADTPDGAWAEFLRHEEITDAEDLLTIRRQLWAVEIGDAQPVRVALPRDVLTGGLDTYPRCQAESRRLRDRGARQIAALSAALEAGAAGGSIVDNGLRPAPDRDGRVIVVFGPPTDLVGWVAADAAHPAVELLDRVHHFHSA